MSFFRVEQLTAGYGGRTVVENVSFEAGEGTVTGILGANGSGKSTLLKSVCGILPHEGGCQLQGQPLEGLSPRQLSRRCSYIPQRSGIVIDIPVLDVVLMGFNPQLGLLERPGGAMIRQARQALAQVGLAGREEDNYMTLSEGQKQLCVLARTLAAGGNLLLLDEPESALDVPHRYRMLDFLESWAAQGQRAALVALHDPGLALACCDQLILLKDGRTCGLLRPSRDTLADMEEALKQIYGKITLTKCLDRAGREHLVMLKERER